MVTEYEPELGQSCFGQPAQRYECPDYVESALQILAEVLEQKGVGYHANGLELDGKTRYKYTKSAFRNVEQRFLNDVFEVHSYDWDTDTEQPYNFKYKDIEVSWYKYLGRGMSINREISVEECWKMLKDCMRSIL